MTGIWNKDEQFHPVSYSEQSSGAGTPLNRKVFVGLSGGVDSAVSAALLKEQGYDVTGVFIKVWQAEFLPCTWREERRDAMRVAAHLNIRFQTLDLEKEYKNEVVDYMIGEYGAGRVPNPDVMCNKHVKFGAFLDHATKHGADLIATGHYAMNKMGADGRFHLFAGTDKEKDQSYFLWTLTQDQLAHTIFPVGHLQKSEVRSLARKFRLPNAEKKDSQGLCFMGAVDMTQFLEHYLKTEKGNVLDEKNNLIGTHNGALLYTIGQRHGFAVLKKSSSEQPYFVIAKDIQENTITVSHRASKDSPKIYRVIKLSICNFISKKLGENGRQKILVRFRHRGARHPATWENVRTSDGAEARIGFERSEEGIAEGQSLVAYENEECLGGGIILRTSP